MYALAENLIAHGWCRGRWFGMQGARWVLVLHGLDTEGVVNPGGNVLQFSV